MTQIEIFQCCMNLEFEHNRANDHYSLKLLIQIWIATRKNGSIHNQVSSKYVKWFWLKHTLIVQWNQYLIEKFRILIFEVFLLLLWPENTRFNCIVWRKNWIEKFFTSIMVIIIFIYFFFLQLTLCRQLTLLLFIEEYKVRFLFLCKKMIFFHTFPHFTWKFLLFKHITCFGCVQIIAFDCVLLNFLLLLMIVSKLTSNSTYIAN